MVGGAMKSIYQENSWMLYFWLCRDTSLGNQFLFFVTDVLSGISLEFHRT